MPRRAPELKATPRPTTDGVLFADWKIEQGHLVRRMVQPSEPRILSANRERQRNPDSMRNLDWGYVLGRIPENLFWLLVKEFPDLNSPHAELRTAAWTKLLNNRDYEQLRVHKRNLARG